MKAAFDDHVITVRAVTTEDGSFLPPGTHGFVVEAHDAPSEHYAVELWVPRDDPPWGDDLVLLEAVQPDHFQVA